MKRKRVNKQPIRGSKETTGLSDPQQIILSANRNHLGNQVSSVLNTWAELSLSFPHICANEEQFAVSNLRQRQTVVEVSDAAGSWKVLETWDKHKETSGIMVLKDDPLTL